MPNPARSIHDNYLTLFKAGIQGSQRRTQNLGITTPFEKQCLHLHHSATKWLSRELDNHGSTLTEEALHELLYQAILDASEAIFPDTPLSEERSDRMAEQMLRYKVWENNPTGFEIFLNNRSIFAQGRTDIEKYKTQHDALQNAYRSQCAPKNIERELEQFDQMFQAYYLDTQFAYPLTQAFHVVHAKQQQKTPANTVQGATIHTNPPNKLAPLTLKKSGIEGLCTELGHESEKHPEMHEYINALQQKLSGYQSLEIEDYARLVEHITNSAEPHAKSTTIPEFTAKAFAVAKKYFYESRAEDSYSELSNKTRLTQPYIRTLLETIKTLEQQTESTAVRTCLSELSSTLQEKHLITLQQYTSLSRETQKKAVATTMNNRAIPKQERLQTITKLISTLNGIDDTARSLFEGLAARAIGRDG